MSMRYKDKNRSGQSFLSTRRWTQLWKTTSVLCLLWVLWSARHTLSQQFRTQPSSAWHLSNQARVSTDLSNPPFSGAFSAIPRISELPPRQKRLTIIAVWNGDKIPSYLRQYFYSIQLNADVLDLLLINRVQTEEDLFMDFEAAGIDITWGGNIKFIRMRDKEWKQRHVDFLCSSKYGWNCNKAQYDEVVKEYANRPDLKNFNWRPLRGYVFNDLLQHPENPFWAWMDLDTFPGDFRRYPFNLLSQVSLVTSNNEPPLIYLGGQLTAFNLDDEDLATAWKKFPELRTSEHFTQNLAGKMPESSEERYWSFGYLRSDQDYPGSTLSYGFYGDLHGDDIFDEQWEKKNASQTYVVSGRDVLLVSTNYTREQIEGLLYLERQEPINDLGGQGWTGGQDGSSYLLNNPNMSGTEAKQLALADAARSGEEVHAHSGLIEDIVVDLEGNCSHTPHWRICYRPHPLTLTHPALLRASFMRLKGQQPGHVLMRLEKEQRPRGYERKLLKHHLWAKRQRWYDFPPFDITEDMVLRLNFDSVEVWRMGKGREETLFYRKNGEESIG